MENKSEMTAKEDNLYFKVLELCKGENYAVAKNSLKLAIENLEYISTVN